MEALNGYTLIHLLLWFIVARFTPLPLIPFFLIATGWEALEIVLPFEFALESIENKVVDMGANLFGYGAGWYLRKTRRSVRSSGN
ncbi:MAG: hypothetical protein CMG71_07340 [Candidatus Marinimicrobia bacterium]|nr:hypothetical protein [Candidatus Neomarinimicrobiota bacterium]|tara:strand:- start:1335 stop:1589 length:255 start_codon:yes stop_codon:yes gene_type:complete